MQGCGCRHVTCQTWQAAMDAFEQLGGDVVSSR